MPAPVLPRLWTSVARWFVANADHVTVRFLPDEDASPVRPYAGYLRLWLVEGFLRRQRSFTADRFPVLHGGASLSFLGSDRATFTTFQRPPEAWSVPGAQLDFPVTPLLPFNGGTVEIEAALYEATTGGPLGTAIELLAGLASLIGPPLATAASIAERVADGLDGVIAGSGAQPVLGLHTTMVAPGGGGDSRQIGSVESLSGWRLFLLEARLSQEARRGAGETHFWQWLK